MTTDEGLALGFKVTMGDDNNVIVVKMDEGSTEKFQFIKQDMRKRDFGDVTRGEQTERLDLP